MATYWQQIAAKSGLILLFLQHIVIGKSTWLLPMMLSPDNQHHQWLLSACEI
jgi:hypothetical protein